MAFRPKIKLLEDPKLPPGYHYEDTLENFLRLSLDKVEEIVVDCIGSGGPEAPHTQEAHEETQEGTIHT